MRRLASHLEADLTIHDLDLSRGRFHAVREIRRLLAAERWSLVYMEGTGITAGLALIWRSLAHRQKYVVSSGDPIGGFFAVTRGPLLGALFSIYERLLYRHCAGFIGWTPYLTGAALKMGAGRGATVEGAVDLDLFRPFPPALRLTTRRQYGIPDHALVCGVVGTLTWSKRQSYCYGLELIETLKRVARSDIYLLIVGDGDGRARLETGLPDPLRSRVIFTGRLPENDVVAAMNALDIGFVTQTLDVLGNFRLTTKLPEYLACGVPVAMSPVPGFFDYVWPAGWSLPACHPGRAEFHAGTAAWLDGLGQSEIEEKRSQARRIAETRFDYQTRGDKFRHFIDQLLAHSSESRSCIG
jgi:glycosyltransferase involved in cell wall biosynthesis